MLNITVCFLLSVLYTVLNSEIVSQWYRMRGEFDNTGSETILQEHQSASLGLCSASCARICGCFGFNSKQKKCRLQKTCNKVSLTDYSDGWRYYQPSKASKIPAQPKDCADISKSTNSPSGIYTIYPFSTEAPGVDVYCDMEAAGGGWTAIQRRCRGSVNFNATWNDYKIGFGIPGDTYWIGNDVIHQLTKDVISYLYINITETTGRSLYELYYQFAVADEAEQYRVFLAGPTAGTLGDAMLDTMHTSDNISGMTFTTFDRPGPIYECANYGTGGGWWYNACSTSNLNAAWNRTDFRGVWNNKVRNMTSVLETLIMIRKHA